MSKVRVTFTEKFGIENYGVVTYHGVMIPLYGLIDKFIEIFYIEVVAEDVKMFYELKFKNKLTIDQKLRLIAETYRGRLQIREFSSFGTNISFAEKQLKFVPDWYIFANGPITKYVLGNNAYSEFYYEPLTEDDKWVRYFGIIPKTVPLITSLFNRTSKVMGRLITGIPAAPDTPNVRESSSRFNRRDPGAGGGPALRHITPPTSPVHTIDAGEISSPLIREPLDDTIDDSDLADLIAEAGGLDLSHIAPSAGDKISTTPDITLEQEEIDSEHDSDEEVKSKPKLDFTQPEIDALKKRQAKEEEALLAHSGERKDLTAAQQRLIDEKSEEVNRATEDAPASVPMELVPSYEEILDPGNNELYFLEYAPDFSEKVTLDSPPAYDTLEQTVIELLPTPKTIQTFMSNVFKIQYQSTVVELKAIASDPTLRKYIPEGTLKSSTNKSTYVKIILKAYTDLVSNQRYDYDEVKEEMVLYNSVAYMLENLGSLTGRKKPEVEKIKTEYIKSLKFDPENLKKLSISERKLKAVKEERMLATMAADQDIVESMTKIGAIEGPKLAGILIDTKTLDPFPPLDSPKNIATVLTLLGHSTVPAIISIMGKRYNHQIDSKAKKPEVITEVKKYFTGLNIPQTSQFITDFQFESKGDITKFAGRQSPQKKT